MMKNCAAVKSLLLPRILFCLFLFLTGCYSLQYTREELAVDEGIVIFTFDDGPNACDNTTGALLDVLKKYNIRAVFALLGVNAERYPSLVRRIHDEGHIIVNHGYTDKFAVLMGDSTFRKNLSDGMNAISRALGGLTIPLLYRPQGAFYTAAQKKIWEEEGYTLVRGSVRPYDAVKRPADAKKVKYHVLHAIMNHRGGIIMLHDGRDSYSLLEKKITKYPDGPFNRSWIPCIIEEIIIELDLSGFSLNGFDVLEKVETRGAL